MNEPPYKSCQSCGMLLKKDPEGGGSNEDGTKSALYCSYCFKNGKFTLPNLTVDGMKKIVKEKLKSFGIPGFLAGLFTRKIPKLKRWKSN